MAMGLVLGAASLAAHPLTFSSGPSRAALIELFTSEGCSSCPAADRWLAALRADPGLWRVFVPVEFHVNYWDSLGWRDRLSTREFTARQYAYASAWGGTGVYTPCFVRNGERWSPLLGRLDAPGETAGFLSVEVGDHGACRAEFAPLPAERAAPGGLEIHVAILGGGISSRVTAGENRGETLTHEFVVLGIAESALSPGPDRLTERAALSLPAPVAGGAARRALAAWVARRGELAPIQATGGWLP